MNEGNSLDYSTTVWHSNLGSGGYMSGNHVDHMVRRVSPGPGAYNSRPPTLHTQGVIFGTVTREPEQYDHNKAIPACTYVDIFAQNPTKGNVPVYTFASAAHKDRCEYFGGSHEAPGPGYYYSESMNNKLEGKAYSTTFGYEERLPERIKSTFTQIELAPPQSVLEARNRFQRFSMVERFAEEGTRRHFRLRFYRKKSEASDNSIVLQNKDRLLDFAPTERFRHLVSNKCRLQTLILSTKRCRESIRSMHDHT